MAKRVLVVYRTAAKADPYAAALTKAAIEPVLAYAGNPVTLRDVHGLLLAGGTDVNPALYKAARHPETEDPDEERDALELKLIGEAMDRNLPLLGICRGLQIFNVFRRGTLIQHLDTAGRHVKEPLDPGQPAHQVIVEPNTLLASIIGRKTAEVNSRHHQAAGKVGEGLRIAARDSEDGTIEALEDPSRRFALAVQWHPENQVNRDAGQFKLFSAFAEAL
jgi:gamma-glutamyl-gamma-aminobutyrate hydrolase PuuD